MLKEKVYALRAGVAGVSLAVPMVAGSMTSFAAEGDSAVTTALTSSVTSIANDITGAVAAMIPLALPIVGAVMVIVIGVKVFKKITSKA